MPSRTPSAFLQALVASIEADAPIDEIVQRIADLLMHELGRAPPDEAMAAIGQIMRSLAAKGYLALTSSNVSIAEH